MQFKQLSCLLAGIAASAGIAGAPAPEKDFRLPEETFFRQNTDFRDNRRVFAWYMVCIGPYNGGWDAPVEEYKKQIRMAQAMGIDGFGLDVMRPNRQYKEAIAKIFQAARELDSGFKLFFKFDYGSRDYEEQVADMVALLKQYGQDKCYEQYQGKPLAGYYGVDLVIEENPSKSVKWWRDKVAPALKAANLDIFFVPTTFVQARKGGRQEAVDASVAEWGDLAQGMSIWQIQTSPFGGGLQLLERQAQAQHKAGKAWMTTVSFHYWWGSNRSVPTSWLWMPGRPLKPEFAKNGTYYEHGGGKGLELQWRSVMEVQKPEWVMLLTWNDYNESYIEPVDDYKNYPNGTSDAPRGWYKPMAGLGELNRYFIQHYKTGVQPEITADSLFWCYRTSSQKLAASADPDRPPVKIGNGPVGDDLYLTTALTAPAELRVNSGGRETRHSVPAGIGQTVVPFQPGRQQFSLWRDGKQLVEAEGEPVVDAIEFYCYWPTTGYATAGR